MRMCQYQIFPELNKELKREECKTCKVDGTNSRCPYYHPIDSQTLFFMFNQDCAEEMIRRVQER